MALRNGSLGKMAGGAGLLAIIALLLYQFGLFVMVVTLAFRDPGDSAFMNATLAEPVPYGIAPGADDLKADPTLKLNVVGHTDNVGGMDSNMKLSMARGEAVVQALVARYGIAADRLKGYGVSSLAPVASNDSDAGRAKNRRVELVKQ